MLSAFQLSAAESAAAKEILTLRQALDKASSEKDLAFLKKHMADDYVWTARRGNQISKQDYLKRIEAGTGFLSQVKDASTTEEGVRVRVFGDTAIVTGTNNYKSPAQQLRILFTEVFTKTDGTWQLVAAHASIPTDK